MPDIRLDFTRKSAPLKKLHGVNNGPVTAGSLVDVTPAYREAGIPLARLHDTNWPNPGEVDIHTIFPDFGKDPEDPASYHFSKTDQYLASIVATGAKIVYRLGESIEHTSKKYYVHPPADYAKWARICIGIIRHYNEGWADGFHHDIRYWEIWNEPDNPDGQVMWSGTDEQYYELYRVASTAIKQHDPSLKVGGQAATMVNHPFTRGFIAYCRQHAVPLDFFTWHTYADDPEKVAANARLVRQWLEEAGYMDMECHLNEWGYLHFDSEEAAKLLWRPEGAAHRKRVFERQKNEEGAAFSAALFALLQDCPVHQANYYDAQPHSMFCGLFDMYGNPQKMYDVFAKFNELCQYDYRIEANIKDGLQGVYALGVSGKNGDSAIWVSNFRGESREYELAWTPAANQRFTHCEWAVLDRERRFDSPEYHDLQSGDRKLSVYLPKYAVLLAKLHAV
ncbi:GH39 family glycosyl hydrolase [Cohnella hashimotonis]|uniref:Glycosyl hydrolases family 39 N-terminal catalytic domain-containing protein n=1 Tax=Cohnella hashimotonis TaxID=2826895 RepID=A0ABT6TKR6_9BACL|nr:hypothetical protein [Cohnella hashimotonis]MDI4647451.1 hypothetical protein [Cohnella hashimotonis]